MKSGRVQRRREAIENVRAFLDARASMRGLDPEEIVAAHSQTGRGTLRVSDLRVLVQPCGHIHLPPSTHQTA